ncbi:RNA 2',3'-cyclic phosphodiesterase [archaeon]|nr:RNA 2',3'-cyclic phosphodiesterase [archaeon]
MRVFLAVDMPKEVKDYLFKLQKKFKGAKVSWTTKRNLHLTLNFLGEMTKEKIEQLTQVIKTIKHKSFKVKLTKLGFFPNEKNPKIIWIGLEPKDKVIEFAHKVDSEILEFTKEQKFEAHITIGRFRSFKKKGEFHKSIKETEIEPIEFEINSFQLIQSILRREGPKYKILENVKMS